MKEPPQEGGSNGPGHIICTRLVQIIQNIAVQLHDGQAVRTVSRAPPLRQSGASSALVV